MLPRPCRLTRAQYLVVRRLGQRFSTSQFTGYFLPQVDFKLAVSISTHLSKLAVRRNLLRRRLMAFFHLSYPSGWLILIPKPIVLNSSCAQLSNLLSQLLSSPPFLD